MGSGNSLAVYYLYNNNENNPPKDIKCEVCGMTFATHQEKEEHKKLEHMEHREPSGVS